MSDQSSIEWTNATWNPVRGCTKISAGCKHCYAETFAERWRGVPGHAYEQGFDLRLVPEALDLPRTWKRPRLVFVNSMSDLFQDEIPLSYIQRVFASMNATPRHGFQVLTKRSARLRALASELDWGGNIWMGVSVESRRCMDRIDDLRAVPAAVRFLSVEPLLESLGMINLEGIHWVIVGGESGRRPRPMEAGWVTGIRDQCLAAGVPFFFKQWGGRNKKQAGRVLDGRTWDEMPVRWAVQAAAK